MTATYQNEADLKAAGYAVSPQVVHTGSGDGKLFEKLIGGKRSYYVITPNGLVVEYVSQAGIKLTAEEKSLQEQMTAAIKAEDDAIAESAVRAANAPANTGVAQPTPVVPVLTPAQVQANAVAANLLARQNAAKAAGQPVPTV